ncbi:MAG: tRNA (N(6)-L-threonylcarbamoyladenosine(37)-C(2))-methylthiotransferase MtaB, partial [Pseudomonadota bacterium]
KARAARLREAGQAGLRRHLEAMGGTRQSVLVERPGFGRAEGYTGVRVSPDHPVGEIAAVRVARHDGASLIEAGLETQAADEDLAA